MKTRGSAFIILHFHLGPLQCAKTQILAQEHYSH
jgi:hypothetical protein